MLLHGWHTACKECAKCVLWPNNQEIKGKTTRGYPCFVAVSLMEIEIKVLWITTSKKPVEHHIRFSQLGIGVYPDNYPVNPESIFGILSLHGGYQAFYDPFAYTTETTNWAVNTPDTEILSYLIKDKYPVPPFRIISSVWVPGEFEYPVFYNPAPGAVPNNGEIWRLSKGNGAVDKSDAENYGDMPDSSFDGISCSHYRTGEHFTSEAVYTSTDLILKEYTLGYELNCASVFASMPAISLIEGKPSYAIPFI